jgi:hypothetical protein
MKLFEKQFIGLRDKHANKIHEGDFVRFYHKGNFVDCEIVYLNEMAMFALKWPDGYINKFPISNSEKMEVIEEKK